MPCEEGENRMNENQYAAEVGDNKNDKAPDQHVLCYMTCPQDGSGASVGALMITDARARPLHFGYTAPIKPTTMQRLMYGPTLNEHLKIDVIANKLLKGMPQVPDVVFVDSEELLVARRLTSIPMAHLARKGDEKDVSASLSTLVYKTNENTSDRDTVGGVIAFLEPQIDLIEPFGRMLEALKEAIKAGGK
jgi:hypothetical protein